MNAGLLRSSDRPQGWPLAELLKKVRLEIEARMVARGAEDEAYPVDLQICALLQQAEGLERSSPRMVVVRTTMLARRR